MASLKRPVDRVLDALAARNLNYGRVAPEGRWKAQCPLQTDRTPSLSIREGDEGRVLIHCFHGCSTFDILSQLGLQWQDLFPHAPDRGYVKCCPTCKRPLP